MKSISNPILRGFNPDPSVVRVGEDYYIATSTFEWFPGVQIHHSRDLENWNLLTRPLDRVSQLDMRGVPDSCGVWAPCLSHCDGVFYLVYSNVKSFDGAWKDTPNFLVTAEQIEGPWSEPIALPSYGFDASLFHDRDDRKWFSSMLVDHRRNKFFGGIVLQEYDHAKRQCVGPIEHIFNGTELGLTEAPHFFQKDGYYYLVTAEGGTEYGHAITVARSKSLSGPYEVHPDNPIMTCVESPDHGIQKSGHGDIFQAHNGQWYIVFLTGSPIESLGRCTLGRETSIEELDWPEGEWPRLKTGGRLPRLEIPAFNLGVFDEPAEMATGGEVTSFAGSSLPSEFQSLRVPVDSSWCSLDDSPNCLRLFGRESLSSKFEQSLLARRVDSFDIQVTTAIEFSPTSFQQMAGLVFYYNTSHWYYLHLRGGESGRSLLQVTTCNKHEVTELLEVPIEIPSHLVNEKVLLRGDFVLADLRFSYSVDGKSFEPVGAPVDGSILSDDYVRDDAGRYRPAFTGAFVGMCCQDLTGSRHHADFHWFEYHNRESVNSRNRQPTEV